MSNEPNILFLATEYAAGMRPYAFAIISALWNENAHAIIVIKDESLKNDFKDFDSSRIHFVNYPTSKIAKAAFRFCPSSLKSEINHVLNTSHIDLVYALTEELVLFKSIKQLLSKVPVLYTVHDAIHHDIKAGSWLATMKDRILMKWPQQTMMRVNKNLVTNSLSQKSYIEAHFPDAKVHYAPFPSLVNEDIIKGGMNVPETQNIQDYILFFGNMHLYKGVDLLYKVYLEHSELQNHPLVLAGSGNIYFERQEQEKGVIFVNRYIDDKELANLFSKAAVVVYPYISATQSGVISLAAHFGRKMVLSDVPFFKQVAGGYEGVAFFKTGDTNDLAQAISTSLNSNDSSSRLYQEVYTTEALKKSLSFIINETLQ